MTPAVIVPARSPPPFPNSGGDGACVVFGDDGARVVSDGDGVREFSCHPFLVSDGDGAREFSCHPFPDSDGGREVSSTIHSGEDSFTMPLHGLPPAAENALTAMMITCKHILTKLVKLKGVSVAGFGSSLLQIRFHKSFLCSRLWLQMRCLIGHWNRIWCQCYSSSDGMMSKAIDLEKRAMSIKENE